MDKKKIKGISKKYMHYAGFILAGALMGLSPQKVSANDYNIVYEQESNNETDFEKYFNSDIPMNNQDQITAESEIYQILNFYEGGIRSETGEFEMQLDPAYNLVVASGLTVKFQEPIINYLSETYAQDSDKILEIIKEKVASGEKVTIPSNIIENCFINEIQTCRDNVINSAENLDINLSESQINVLTELNYRYGQKQSEAFLQFVLEGNNIEEYSVRIQRSMPETQWENSNLNIETEIISRENGIVTYNAYEKPFLALKEFDGSINELINLDIKSEVESAEMQFNGDKRRALFRQIGIMCDVCPIVVNNDGICRYTIDGITYDSSLIDYLSNYGKVQNIEEQDKYEPNKDKEELENTLIGVIDGIKQDSDSIDVNDILNSFQEDNINTGEQENVQDEEEKALVPVKEKNKFKFFKIFANLSGASLIALGVKKIKDAIKKRKDSHKCEEKPLVELKDKRKMWLENIKVNMEQNKEKSYEFESKLKIFFEVVNRRENELPKLFEFSQASKKELYRDVKKEIVKYKTKSVHTKVEKEEYREARDYKIILENEELIKKISKIKGFPRTLIYEKLKKDVFEYKQRNNIQKNDAKRNEQITEMEENII